jgi:glyoxylase I family protein
VAFAVADLDAAYDHAVARGARPVMPPCPAPEPGVRMAFVADPEGNLVELLDRGRKQ